MKIDKNYINNCFCHEILIHCLSSNTVASYFSKIVSRIVFKEELSKTYTEIIVPTTNINAKQKDKQLRTVEK